MDRLWIDDLRFPPDIADPNCPACSQYFPCRKHIRNTTSWEWVKTYDEAIEAFLTKTEGYEVVSFDNDLGESSKEGYQIADWLEAAVYTGKVLAPRLTAVHSANPVASGRIKATLRRFTLIE